MTAPPAQVAVLSTSVPPANSGQARVLAQLLGDPTSTARPVWLTENPPGGPEAAAALPLPRGPLLPARLCPRPLADLNRRAGLAALVVARARAALRAAPGAAGFVGCSGSPFDLPAASLAARWARRPLVAWLFDDPVFQWAPDTGPGYRAFARWCERRWAPRAAAVIAPNETMAEDFAARHPGLRPAFVVRNPAADAAFGDAEGAGAPWPGTATILYTGSVYSAQADAMRNLVAALDGLEGFRLVVHSAQSAAEIAALGIAGPAVEVRPALGHAATLEAQRRAEVLFLPLAFGAPIPEVIRSSAPAKASEYLASGRPALVHAPPGAFVGRMFGGGAGLVVDAPDPAALRAALRRLRDGPGLRAALAAEAGRRAGEYRAVAARAALARALAAAGVAPAPVAAP